MLKTKLLVFCRTNSKVAQFEKFWEQGDYGHIIERIKTITTICQPEKEVSITFYDEISWSKLKTGMKYKSESNEVLQKLNFKVLWFYE